MDKGVETLQTIKEQLAVYRQAVLTSLYPEMTEENTVSLDAIADITSGITKGRKLDGQDTLRLPYLRVANVQNGYLDLSEMKSIELKPSEREKYLLKYGDVLYTEGGDRDKLGRGTSGEMKSKNVFTKIMYSRQGWILLALAQIRFILVNEYTGKKLFLHKRQAKRESCID